MRLGNDAVTIVAPEPPVRTTEHSPPESSGATSGTNARSAASPDCGEKDSPIATRVRVIGWFVDETGAAAGSGAGPCELQATIIAEDSMAIAERPMITASALCEPEG
jgi:hypothetical protein